MFWRNDKGTTAGVDQKDWPKNGTILFGWKIKNDGDGLVKLDNGHFMQIKQYGNVVLHEVNDNKK